MTSPTAAQPPEGEPPKDAPTQGEPTFHPVGGVRSANFLKFWTGQTLAQFGARLAAVALPVLAVDILHATEADLGYLNAAQTAAFLLVGLPAGAWVDRWFKRRTMIWADLARFVASFAVPVLYFTHQLHIWHLFVVGAVIGVASVFFDVSYQSFVPVLVPDEDIGTANARLETTSQIATMGGPALGGLVLKVISAPVLMLADAVGYLASVVFLSLTRDDESSHRQRLKSSQPATEVPASLVREIREGLSFVVQHPALRRIVMCTGIANAASTIVFTLEPILVLRQLGLSPFLMGLILTSASLGGALRAMLTARAQRVWPAARVLIVGTLVACLGTLSAPISGTLSNKWVGLTLLLLGGFLTSIGVMLYNITQVSMRQRLCPKNLLGRMNASIRFIVWGVMPLSALVAGWLGDRFGLVPTLWLGAIAAFCAVLPLLGIAPHLPKSEAQTS